MFGTVSARWAGVAYLSVLLLRATACPLSAEAQSSAYSLVRGIVTDLDGLPLAYANVQIVGTTDGAATAADGHFAFRTQHTGAQQIQAALMGFETYRQPLHLAPGDTVTVYIVLRETVVALPVTLVEADAYTTGEAETATLQPLEVVTTASAAADIFRAIQTFPGVAIVDEGAGLYVRGGDVSETVILLDQATLVHPYKYESPTGGMFGIIPPFMVRGTVFSSGGFSARYGNALSAVLAMDSQDLPEAPQYLVGLGLAAASLGAHIPILPGKLGVRFSGNRSFTGTMFRLNGQRDQFVTPPRSYDGNLSIIYQYSPTGRLKAFNFTTEDRLGVLVPEPSFRGIFRGQTTSWLHNMQWIGVLGAWYLQSSVSLNRYAARKQLGVLKVSPRDHTQKLRLDAERQAGRRLRIGLGGEIERTRSYFQGTVPARARVLNSAASVLRLSGATTATRIGLYGEGEIRTTDRLFALAGARMDFLRQTDQAVVDPRLSIRYVVSQRVRFRLAWGLYHQFPSPYEYGAVVGQAVLKPQSARHFIAGFLHERERLMLRLELYDKVYRNLAVAANESGYLSIGSGKVRGLDFFVKYGAYLQTRFNGWLSYSLLDSRRLQARNQGHELTFEQGPSPYDITHNLTLVAKARIFGALYGSLTFRQASGRPITPVEGAISDAEGRYFLPVEGPPGSERLSDFRRLDLSANYFMTFGSHNATFYVSVGNALNRANVLDYNYALDYSSRSERTTRYRRFLYFGVAANIFP